MRRGILLATGVAATLAPACDDGGSPLGLRLERARLEAARAAWEAAEPAAYLYEFRRSCFCDPRAVAQVRIEVEGGVVVAATYLEDVHGSEPIPAGSPVPSEALHLFGPVESIFDLIESAIENEPRSLEVVYHPANGLPTFVSVTQCAPDCADDGLTIEAGALAPRFGDG